MLRKTFYGALILAVMGLAGCESIPKKFIRKKPAPAHVAQAVYLDQGPYQKPYSNEYFYKNHFTLWQTWHDDMMKSLTGNSKKLRRATEETYSHLDQMGNYLKPEPQARLKLLTDIVNGYRWKFDRGTYSRSDAGNVLTELERVKRLVANDFYYEKVKEDILPDRVDLGE